MWSERRESNPRIQLGNPAAGGGRTRGGFSTAPTSTHSYPLVTRLECTVSARTVHPGRVDNRFPALHFVGVVPDSGLAVLRCNADTMVL